MERVRGGSFKALELLCTVVTADNIEDMLKLAETTPTAIVELRVDYLNKLDESLAKLGYVVKRVRESGKTVIITVRSREEGGLYEGSESRKARLILEIAESEPHAVDIEIRHGLVSGVLQELKKRNTKAILSHHDFTGTPSASTLDRMVERALKAGGDIVKVVTTARSPADNRVTLGICNRWKRKVVSFCMGKYGIPSRLLAPFYGAPFTYARHDMGVPTAEGQLSVSETLLLWKKMGLIQP
uniref:3-dehydroquinate dehydratase n=1 Tax=Fervidicoccus fontis TaxID=683846 RepID=A0A7J3ZL29_9CREN